MPHYDFKKDFQIARKSEKQIAEYLVEKLNMEFIDECNNADYDIRMKTADGKTFTIEIKEDFTCQRTGNVGVEYSSWGRDSGIAISKSDLYMYKVHQPDGKIGLYAINTKKLKRMISDEKYFRTVTGGDVGSNSMNYLFKLNVIKENFQLIGWLPE